MIRDPLFCPRDAFARFEEKLAHIYASLTRDVDRLVLHKIIIHDVGQLSDDIMMMEKMMER